MCSTTSGRLRELSVRGRLRELLITELGRLVVAKRATTVFFFDFIIRGTTVPLQKFTIR